MFLCQISNSSIHWFAKQIWTIPFDLSGTMMLIEFAEKIVQGSPTKNSTSCHGVVLCTTRIISCDFNCTKVEMVYTHILRSYSVNHSSVQMILWLFLYHQFCLLSVLISIVNSFVQFFPPPPFLFISLRVKRLLLLFLSYSYLHSYTIHMIY